MKACFFSDMMLQVIEGRWDSDRLVFKLSKLAELLHDENNIESYLKVILKVILKVMLLTKFTDFE